ncbi:MAG: hypothetical protein AAF289_11310, partial [Cyanobacteria bacterium P01_A01_bin.135]
RNLRPMNEPTSSSGDRVNFPSAIGAGAQERQTQYRERRQSPNGSGNGNGVSGSSEALVALAQDLTQQNHQLRDRVAQLEAQLAGQNNGRPAAPIGDTDESAAGSQVAYLLNQLEFAQQANQRQAIRIDSLAQQSNSDRLHLRQLEQDNSAFQSRCRVQANRIADLTQRCSELQQRLQRQQRYTLQLKAALDRCLEVPPPSYTAPEAGHAADMANAAIAEVTSSGSTSPTPNPPAPTEIPPSPQPAVNGKVTLPAPNDVASLTSPLLPKPNSITPWSQRPSPNGHSSSARPSADGAEIIPPLKPAPQVPQMSHFKTTLFNLAHQPPTEEASGAQANGRPSISHNLAHGATNGDLQATNVLNLLGLGAEASEPGESPGATDDAFWTDLVQMVAKIEPQVPSPPEEAPNSLAETTAETIIEVESAPPTPPVSKATAPAEASQAPAGTQRTASNSEGVDTLFDVVLQGAKAIASQLRPADSSSDRDAPPAAEATDVPEAAPVVAEAPASEAGAGSPPTTGGDADGWSSPKQGDLPGKRSRIDLPTFLKPQPQ